MTAAEGSSAMAAKERLTQFSKRWKRLGEKSY